ncbi:hypothetical protein NB231_11364 [Nitrococcus mobilis Nb-231]|uniref:Uncharacterized protein n=1 Tax=Nitrococcus mobilis Nb-231 TaxID=314278 RepID=A4BP30_9GAMM|nr:hypothetical protein NB231_11364 [Nitrococcus mobilis Nb-231]
MRHVVDDVAFVAGTQQLEEVDAALGGRAREEGEQLIADVSAEAVATLVTSAGVVDMDELAALQGDAQQRLGDVVVLIEDERAQPRPEVSATELHRQAAHAASRPVASPNVRADSGCCVRRCADPGR